MAGSDVAITVKSVFSMNKAEATTSGTTREKEAMAAPTTQGDNEARIYRKPVMSSGQMATTQKFSVKYY